MNRWIIVFIVVFVFTGLACNFSLQAPWNQDNLAGDISAEEVASAATTAAESAATAAALIGPMSEIAGTALAQGDDVLATAVAQAGVMAGTAQLLPTAQAIATDIAATAQAAAGSIVGTPAPGGSSIIQNKLAGIQPDASGLYHVDVTEEEFNQIITTQLAGPSGGASPIQNAVVAIENGSIVLDGDVTQPLATSISVTFRPIVENGDLRFDVSRASLGGFPASGGLLTTVENTLNSSISTETLGLPSNIILQEILVGDGIMTILARQT